MKSDSYVVELDGTFWMLHVFNVEGEKEEIGIILSFRSREACAAFPDGFSENMLVENDARKGAALCRHCRAAGRGRWLSKFSDWVKSAYSALEHPPAVHDDREVPEVVRLSLECALKGEPEDGLLVN